MPLRNDLEKIISQVCDTKSVLLYSAELQGSGKNQILRIVVDTEAGITLDECTRLNREISDMLFRKDPGTANYRLEVTSPGVDKPLEKDFEFKRNIGRDLIVEFEEEGQVHNETGKLSRYTGNLINIETKNGLLEIPLTNLKKAKVKLKW